MTSDFTRAKAIIDQSQNIILTTHERTDGDDFGTVSALKTVLDNLNKRTAIIIKGGIPKNLTFLNNSNVVFSNLEDINFTPELLIISGCSNKNRIGIPELENLSVPTINIDHHPDNTKYGDINIVDEFSSSVAELTEKFIAFSNWPLNHHSATALLTGIMSDTGSFIYNSTKSSTLRAAANLMKHGAHTNLITKHTFQGKPIQTLKAWARAINNSKLNPLNGCISTAISKNDIIELNNTPHSSFEGLVETLNKVKQSKFAIFLKEDGEIIKGSIRSESNKNIDVRNIAKLFGGGGHTLASGFTLKGKLSSTNNSWHITS